MEEKVDLFAMTKEFVELKGIKLPTHEFLLTCLDEVLERKEKSSYNGVPFTKHYPQQELIRQILESWLHSAQLFLAPDRTAVSNFHGVPVPTDVDLRAHLLRKLSQLGCKFHCLYCIYILQI